MFLDYFALGILVFVAVFLFYGVIAIHDIPYEISKERNHPHQDAIHYAGWVSLFTLHTIWPFLWLWATLWREDRGCGLTKIQNEQLYIGAFRLPQGTNVEIAVYSDSFEHVYVMRKVLIRMKSWQNYLFLDH
ncbi:DUF3302 domain-containing protein [Photobacterium proteolyticum]|uniref:DUF3302 domain-containing protein n=1 Tax=Photobacterium proteolyticum TaxID=1903952 RepID=UPI0009F98C08